MVTLDAGTAPQALEGAPGADRAVGWWLVCVCALVALMILVGGATRLTDSGLSITEWRPVTGAIPPLDAADWAAEFAKYQTTTEYQRQNAGMSLAEFQTIYWWEWGHRQLGRVIGLVYALPFLGFLLAGRLRGRVAALTGLLALGALQGFVGWWMVESGLSERLDVAPYRLAAHLGLAFVILGWGAWLALGAFGAGRGQVSWAIGGFLGLLFVQILAGAAVAGSDAGKAYADWPSIGGELFPSSYAALQPFWHNLFENHATVQFHHRTLGYLVALAALGLGALAWRRGGRVLGGALAAVALSQALLGVATVLGAAPLGLSLAHQSGAVLLWLLGVAQLRCGVR